MTKAVGSTAAMQPIDRGKLSFDTPVVEILPAFAELQVLEGFDGDEPIVRAPKRAATVRHLATHTSGLVHEFWSDVVARWFELNGRAPILSGSRRASRPLRANAGGGRRSLPSDRESRTR